MKAILLITITFMLTVGFQPVVISSDTAIKKNSRSQNRSVSHY